MILDSYEKFLSELLTKTQELGLDVSGLPLDHVAYQAASDNEYDQLTTNFAQLGSLVSEEIIGGRRVGIYRLHTPLEFAGYGPQAIELIAPVAGQTPPSALEHVEFSIDEPFAEFMARYPELPWDSSATARPQFPVLKLRLSPTMQVKFRHGAVLDE